MNHNEISLFRFNQKLHFLNKIWIRLQIKTWLSSVKFQQKIWTTDFLLKAYAGARVLQVSKVPGLQKSKQVENNL